MKEALATADYRIYGKGYDGADVDETVHAELRESGAFKYGNGTCMVLKWSYGHTDSFDTRYEKVNVWNFTEFAKKVIESRVLDTIKVEVI